MVGVCVQCAAKPTAAGVAGDIYIQGGPKKTGPFFYVDNFATVSGRKACDMSKVCKFCLEKKYKTCIAVV